LEKDLLFIKLLAVFFDSFLLASGLSGKLDSSFDFSFRVNDSSRGTALNFSVFGSLFLLLLDSVVFVKGGLFIFKGLKLVVTCLDLSFHFIQGCLLLILLSDRGPEFHTSTSQRKENGLISTMGLEVVHAFEDRLFLMVHLVKV
jgi:hypothetical protein